MSRSFEKAAVVAGIIEENLPTTGMPDFMVRHIEDELQRGESRFNILEARSKYVRTVGGAGHDEGRLDLLVAGEEATHAKSTDEIMEIINENYPSLELEIGDKRYQACLDARVKAKFLDLALNRYLEIAGMPARVINDLHKLLSSFFLAVSEGRARAQRTLLLYSKLSLSQIAHKADVNQSDLSQWLKANHVIDPYAEGRPAARVPRRSSAQKPQA